MKAQMHSFCLSLIRGTVIAFASMGKGCLSSLRFHSRTQPSGDEIAGKDN